MKSRITNPVYHILFWLVVTTILVMVFGRSWNNNLHAFYFITLLLPVVMATSYFFNYYLVPYFLLKKKIFLVWFVLLLHAGSVALFSNDCDCLFVHLFCQF